MSFEMPIKHNCKLNCSKCGEESFYNITIDDFEGSSSYERGMGPEIQHEYTTYVECSNPDCGAEIEIHGEVCEYPEGAINFITPEN